MALPTAGPQQHPTFPAQADNIVVDVVVLDREGRPVRGLEKEDFSVLEDGTARTIESFEIHEPLTAGEDSPARPGPVATNAGASDRGGRVMAFILDDLGLDGTRGRQAQQAVEDWLQERADPRDEITLLTTSGEVFWSDRVARGGADVLRALESVKPRATPLSGSELCIVVPEAPEASRRHCDNLRRAQAQQAAELHLQRQRAMLEAVERLSAAFAHRRGRKSIFILSPSLLPDQPPGALDRAMASAQEAGVAVYFVDVRGLTTEMFANPLAAVAGGDELARSTGGALIAQSNDLSGDIARAADESSFYYLLGYPREGPPDGKWHGLEVHVGRPGVTVRARRGYVAALQAPWERPLGERGARTEDDDRVLEAALAAGPDRDAIPLQMACRALGPTTGGVRVLVALGVDVSRLVSASGAAGSGTEFEITLVGASQGLSSVTVDTRRVLLRPNPGASAAWWPYTRELVLPPGVAQVRARVAAATGQEGMVSQRYEVPAAETESPNDFDHEAAPFVFEPGDGKRRTEILLSAPAAAVDPAGEVGQLGLILGARVEDVAGRVIERLSEAWFQDGSGRRARLRTSVLLEPGDYVLESALVDMVGGALSVVRRPFRVSPAGEPAPRPLHGYGTIVAEYLTGDPDRAVHEIRRWRPDALDAGVRALREDAERREKLLLPSGEELAELPVEIDFRMVEAAALMHVEAGLLELQALDSRRAESHFSAATHLVELSHDLQADRRRERAGLLEKLRGSAVGLDPALSDEIDRALSIELKIDTGELYVALAAATLAVGFPETALSFAEGATAALALDGEALLVRACANESLALEEEVRTHEGKARRLREEAEALFRETLAADPAQGEARLRLGRVLLTQGRPDEAEPLLRQAAEEAPDERQRYLALLFLGGVSEQGRNPDDGAAFYRRAVETWPDSQAARLGLARCLEASEGPSAARSLVKASLLASRRSVRAPDPWWSYPSGPPGLAKVAVERLWQEVLGRPFAP